MEKNNGMTPFSFFELKISYFPHFTSLFLFYLLCFFFTIFPFVILSFFLTLTIFFCPIFTLFTIFDLFLLFLQFFCPIFNFFDLFLHFIYFPYFYSLVKEGKNSFFNGENLKKVKKIVKN